MRAKKSAEWLILLQNNLFVVVKGISFFKFWGPYKLLFSSFDSFCRKASQKTMYAGNEHSFKICKIHSCCFYWDGPNNTESFKKYGGTSVLIVNSFWDSGLYWSPWVPSDEALSPAGQCGDSRKFSECHESWASDIKMWRVPRCDCDCSHDLHFFIWVISISWFCLVTCFKPDYNSKL